MIRHLTVHNDVTSFRPIMRKHDNDIQDCAYCQVHRQILGLFPQSCWANKTVACRKEKEKVLLSFAVEIFWYDSCILWFFFRTSYVCTAHNTVHCIGIEKTSSSVLHGQWHPQDFLPPEHSHYLRTGGNQPCFPQNWKILENTDNLNNIMAFLKRKCQFNSGGKSALPWGHPNMQSIKRKSNNLEAFQNKFWLKSRGESAPPWGHSQIQWT